MEAEIVHTGTVVMVSPKGYGFLRFDDSKEEIFYHISGCINGFLPSKGTHVQFTIGASRGKPIALDLTEKID